MFTFLPIHLIIITLFFGFRYYTSKIKSYSPTLMLPLQGVVPKFLLIPILLISMFVIQGFSNKMQLFNKCNVDMTQTAFMTSAIVTFLIFGTIVSVIESVPIIKGPFDNTFGYFLSGMNVETIRTVVNKIYVPKIRYGDSNVLESILNNEGLMLNTVRPSNFQMKMLPLKVPNTNRANDAMMKYYNLVLKKDLIGSFVWYVLAAAVAVLINSESMNNIKCKKTNEDIVKNLSSISLDEI
jgi:hypothetical protein